MVIRRPFKKSSPQEQHALIEQIAQEIYQNRILLGRVGDAQSDWETAEKIVQSPWRTTLFASNRPLIKAEKYLFEPCSSHLKNSAVFDIVERVSPALEAIGVIAGAIIIPVVIWQVGDREQESKERQERAVRAQTAVQNYLNQLSDILATGRLKTSEDLQTIVRASTLALLDNPDLQPDPELNGDDNLLNDRKGQTIAYLYEAGLVHSLEQPQDNNQSNEQTEPLISLVGANLSGSDLSYFDFSSANFSYVNLNDANLSNAVLTNANLDDAYLIDANLRSANLIGVNLSDAYLDNANLSFVDLSNADLNDADLVGADLSNAQLIGVNLNEAFLSGANLTNANLSNANLNEAKLGNADLRNANLSNADLSEAYLKGAIINENTKIDAKWRLVWKIVNRRISNAKLSNTDLSGANLRAVNFRNANLAGTNLSNARLFGTNFSNANLRNSSFSDASLFGANLSDAKLIGANLSNAGLTNANLSNADLTNANLTNANLTNANSWTDEQFARALLCNTELPQGINLDPDRDCKELGISPD